MFPSTWLRREELGRKIQYSRPRKICCPFLFFFPRMFFLFHYVYRIDTYPFSGSAQWRLELGAPPARATEIGLETRKSDRMRCIPQRMCSLQNPWPAVDRPWGVCLCLKLLAKKISAITTTDGVSVFSLSRHLWSSAILLPSFLINVPGSVITALLFDDIIQGERTWRRVCEGW